MCGEIKKHQITLRRLLLQYTSAKIYRSIFLYQRYFCMLVTLISLNLTFHGLQWTQNFWCVFFCLFLPSFWVLLRLLSSRSSSTSSPHSVRLVFSWFFSNCAVSTIFLEPSLSFIVSSVTKKIFFNRNLHIMKRLCITDETKYVTTVLKIYQQ